jgi:hypothetical protein
VQIKNTGFTSDTCLIQSSDPDCWLKTVAAFCVRDAVFRVLAVEQPQATVLNYAPGPLDTPMIAELLADTRTDPGMLRHFISY